MTTKLSNYFALFCFALSLVFVGRAILATDSAEASVDLQTVTEVSSELAVKPASVAIEEIRIGDRVLAHNPEESEADRSTWTEPYWDQWLTLDLEMQKEGGGLLQIKLLRSRDWLQAQLVPSSQSALQLISGLSIDSAAEIEAKISAALSAGLAVEMDLPELGLTGHAKVLAIGPPPLVESGAGQVVTATFRHSSVDVIDLTFRDAAGAEETLGTTSNHPFWSVDQQEFVQAGSLTEGDRLLSLDGQIQQVVHAESRIAGDPVFNIEVHQEHVYFVGHFNVLVHNANEYVFRGTTRGFLGRLDVTFTSTNPAAATVFAVQKKNLGTPVIEIVNLADLANVKRLPSVSPTLAKIEREIIFDIPPGKFSELATQVPLKDALRALDELGITIPSNVRISELSSVLEALQDLSPSQIRDFLEKVGS